MAGLLGGARRMRGLLGGPVQADAADEWFLRRQRERGREEQFSPPPMASAPPPRQRVSAWRVLDGVLGGGTISESLDAERARMEQERFRPQMEARQARIQAYVDGLPPDLQLAFAANPEKLGEALATRGEARVLDQGDVYTVGGAPTYAAPFEAAPGSSIFDPMRPDHPVAVAAQENKVAGGALVDPTGRVLYRGPQVEGVAGTADAFYMPEIAQGAGGGAPQVVRQARPDTVTLQPGGEAIQLNPDGSVAGRVASTQTRPISDADQKAIAEAEGNIARLDNAVGRASTLLSQIEGGRLNLGPVTNIVSGVRNATGQSNTNSLGYADLRNWAEEARNEILQAANGVQTEGDALRALNVILSGTNDERMVMQALQRYMAAKAATREVFERDIARRQPPQAGQGGVSREAAIAELRRRGLIQ